MGLLSGLMEDGGCGREKCAPGDWRCATAGPQDRRDHESQIVEMADAAMYDAKRMTAV